MNSSTDITAFSTRMLANALETLQIAAAEDDGD